MAESKLDRLKSMVDQNIFLQVHWPEGGEIKVLGDGELLVDGKPASPEEFTNAIQKMAALWKENMNKHTNPLSSKPVLAPPSLTIHCPECNGTKWGGGTDADPQPWCKTAGCDGRQPVIHSTVVSVPE